MFCQYFMPAEPRSDWSHKFPNDKKKTDMTHLLEEFDNFIKQGRHPQKTFRKTVRKNAHVFLTKKIGHMALSKEKAILVNRLSSLYNRNMGKGLVGPGYNLADGKRAVIGRWVRDKTSSVHYIVGLSDAGAKVVNMDTIVNGHNSMTVPYEDIRFQDYRTGKELILTLVQELKNACIMARHLYVGGSLKRALFRFRGKDIKPIPEDEEQVATIDFPATIRGDKRVKLFCNFVTATPYDYVLFQNVRFGAPVITRCDTKFTQCSFETVDTPIQKESHTVTFKKCQRVTGLTIDTMDSLEEDAETDDDQPEVVGHETPAQGIEKRRKAAEVAGQLIDLSHSVGPEPIGLSHAVEPKPIDLTVDLSHVVEPEPYGGETKTPPAPAPTPAPAHRQFFSSSDEDDEDDNDHSDDDIVLSDAEDEEEQEERVTRIYGVPRKDYPFKSCAVIAAASTALSGITTPGIYRIGKGAYVFEHNSTDTEHQGAIEALERVGLTVAVFRGEEDYDIVPMNDLDRRYVVQNCDWCGQYENKLLWEDDGQYCEACDRILYPESWEK
jgi:hypothetical protein